MCLSLRTSSSRHRHLQYEQFRTETDELGHLSPSCPPHAPPKSVQSLHSSIGLCSLSTTSHIFILSTPLYSPSFLSTRIFCLRELFIPLSLRGGSEVISFFAVHAFFPSSVASLFSFSVYTFPDQDESSTLTCELEHGRESQKGQPRAGEVISDGKPLVVPTSCTGLDGPLASHSPSHAVCRERMVVMGIE
jgi:hypothetical protein